MIQSIFEFKDTLVREIMVPRTEIVGVDAEALIQTIIDLMVKHGHSRLPIYSENLDNVIGLLHVKDLLPYWGRPTDQSLPREVVRQPFFVPETKKIVQLLKELRGQKFHMALVLDEYGGISGLVTMEDIIEEIIGEIEDEYDRQEPRLVPLEEGRAEVDARLEIEELENFFNLEIGERDFESVGGFVIHLLGRVAQGRRNNLLSGSGNHRAGGRQPPGPPPAVRETERRIPRDFFRLTLCPGSGLGTGSRRGSTSSPASGCPLPLQWASPALLHLNVIRTRGRIMRHGALLGAGGDPNLIQPLILGIHDPQIGLGARFQVRDLRQT